VHGSIRADGLTVGIDSTKRTESVRILTA
jgi:hypothetical protein